MRKKSKTDNMQESSANLKKTTARNFNTTCVFHLLQKENSTLGRGGADISKSVIRHFCF